MGRHALAVGGLGKEPVNHPAVSPGRHILEISVNVIQTGRQSGQVKGHASDQFLPGGLGIELQALGRESPADKGVNGIVPVPGPRHFHLRRCNQRPVFLVGSPLLYPLLQGLDLLRAHGQLGIRGGHALIGIITGQARQEFTALDNLP